MLRKALAWQVVLVALAVTSVASAQSNHLVPQNVAARHGLRRAWFTVVALDRAIGKIAHITQHGGTLFVQTTQAMVHAIDAETGRTVWIQQIGMRNRPSLEPAANDEVVAILNGSTLYVVDRKTGLPKWERRVAGSPDAGPALSATHVFCPMSDGLVQGFPIKDSKAAPWIYKSNGHLRVQPIVTATTVSWPTDKGHFYVAETEKVQIKCRIETHDPIEARAAYWTPYLYACSLDGYVYAVHEKTGNTDWKFATGDPISRPPAAIDGKVYVVSDAHQLYCLDGSNSKQLWTAQGVAGFLAASPKRIYATDKLGRMLILDAKTGARIDIMPIEGLSIKLTNTQSDRIFLADRTGLVQCFHEMELRKPVLHIPPAPEKPGEKPAEVAKPKAKPAAGGDDEAMEAPAVEDAMPADEMPAEEAMPADDDNPF